MIFADSQFRTEIQQPYEEKLETREAALVASRGELLNLREVVASQVGELIADKFIGNDEDGVNGTPYQLKVEGVVPTADKRAWPRMIVGEAARFLAMSAVQGSVEVKAVDYFLANGETGPEKATTPTLNAEKPEQIELFHTATVPVMSETPDTVSNLTPRHAAPKVRTQSIQGILARHIRRTSGKHAQTSVS